MNETKSPDDTPRILTANPARASTFLDPNTGTRHPTGSAYAKQALRNSKESARDRT